MISEPIFYFQPLSDLPGRRAQRPHSLTLSLRPSKCDLLSFPRLAGGECALKESECTGRGALRESVHCKRECTRRGALRECVH